MKRLFILSLVLLVAATTALAQSGVKSDSGNSGQGSMGPVSKQELILLLRDRSADRMPQAYIADMVAARGLAFRLDDQAVEELRAAGAQESLINAIKRSVAGAGIPKLNAPPADDSEPPSPPPVLSTEETRRERDAEIAKLPFLEQARVHALDFSEELPNFVVTQRLSRYKTGRETGGKWVPNDRMTIEETYRVGKGEQLRIVTLNGRFATIRYDQLDGATSTGEFSASLSAIFLPESHTEFTLVNHVQFRGRDAAVYRFKVLEEYSRMTITDKSTGQSVVPGYSGSVWIDNETKRVLRLEESADPPPPSFPITHSESAVEYDWVAIGGDKYFLPVHAEVLLGRDSDRTYAKNVIDFVNYHKFEGEIKVLPDSN